MADALDAIVVGAGHNGLAAAVTLARAGLSVRVYEGADSIGGGTRTAELTLPGFRHDTCAAVHPLAFASPFFSAFGLSERIPFLTPEVSFGHPLDDGSAALAYRDLDRTAERLGSDGGAYRRLMRPLSERARELARMTGSPLIPVPRHPLLMARLGLRVLEQGTPAWGARFRGEAAPALLAGAMAHSILHMPSLAMAAAGLTLVAHAHAGGWPLPVGGTQAIADALADDLRAHGGEIVTSHTVNSLAELPPARVVIADVTPRALLGLAGDALPSSYRRALERFRYGNGVAKVDLALSGPVPWSDPALGEAVTVHLGGTRAEIARAENSVSRGQHAERPYVLLVQPTVLDPSRAPAGKHIVWAYTHVPAGSPVDQLDAIVARIEEYAPGFRDTVLASRSVSAAHLPDDNPNYVGGDISAGRPDVLQLVRRPVLSAEPWRTPVDGLYLCGASTVPGPGVHGMSGWWAARSALRREFGRRTPSLAP